MYNKEADSTENEHTLNETRGEEKENIAHINVV